MSDGYAESYACPHESSTGDEGPIVDLGSRHVVRWRCDACNTVYYSDAALASLRAELAAVRQEAVDWKVQAETLAAGVVDRDAQLAAVRVRAEQAEAEALAISESASEVLSKKHAAQDEARAQRVRAERAEALSEQAWEVATARLESLKAQRVRADTTEAEREQFDDERLEAVLELRRLRGGLQAVREALLEGGQNSTIRCARAVGLIVQLSPVVAGTPEQAAWKVGDWVRFDHSVRGLLEGVIDSIYDRGDRTQELMIKWPKEGGYGSTFRLSYSKDLAPVAGTPTKEGDDEATEPGQQLCPVVRQRSNEWKALPSFICIKAAGHKGFHRHLDGNLWSMPAGMPAGLPVPEEPNNE